MTKAAQPSTAGEIVDLIRRRYDGAHSVTRAESINLIEQYAAVAAAEASIKATSEAHDKAMAVFDAAMSEPLAPISKGTM